MVDKISHLGVSRHKAVHVVVDLLEDEASVHESKAALRGKKAKQIDFWNFTSMCKPQRSFYSESALFQSGRREPTLMNTARLWLALRAASRLSLYF